MQSIYDVNRELLPSTALTADIEGAQYPVAGLPRVGVVVTWAGLTGTLDAEFFLEVSNDGTNWGALTSPVAVGTASGSDPIKSAECFFTYVRLNVVKNGVTGGTISATISLFP